MATAHRFLLHYWISYAYMRDMFVCCVLAGMLFYSYIYIHIVAHVFLAFLLLSHMVGFNKI